MIITSFGFKDIKYFFNNFLYLYLVSIVLGGFLYLLNIEFSYHQEGLIFVKDGLSVNFLVLLLLSPTILIFYIYSSKKLKLNYNNYHDVIIYYKNQKYKFTGYLDTGNKLYDQYKKRPVILVDNHDNKFSFSYSEGILVSYETASNKSILKCLPADRVVVDDVVYENVLIGLLDKSFKIDGVDLILHSQLIGGTK